MLGIADRIKKKKLSVRDTERIVSQINSLIKNKNKKVKIKSNKSLEDIENKLVHKFGTKVSILFPKTKKGKIVFEYYSKDDLNRILNLLLKKL